MQKSIIDHADSPEMNNYLLGLDNGDEGEFLVKFRKISTDGGRTEVQITGINLDYEEENIDFEPSVEEPLTIAIVETSEMEDISSEEGDEEGEEMIDLDDAI